MRLNVLHSNVVRAVLDEAGEQSPHDDGGSQRVFRCASPCTPRMPIHWPTPIRWDRSSLFRSWADVDLACVGNSAGALL